MVTEEAVHLRVVDHLGDEKWGGLDTTNEHQTDNAGEFREILAVSSPPPAHQRERQGFLADSKIFFGDNEHAHVRVTMG